MPLLCGAGRKDTVCRCSDTAELWILHLPEVRGSGLGVRAKNGKSGTWRRGSGKGRAEERFLLSRRQRSGCKRSRKGSGAKGLFKSSGEERTEGWNGTVSADGEKIGEVELVAAGDVPAMSLKHAIEDVLDSFSL